MQFRDFCINLFTITSKKITLVYGSRTSASHFGYTIAIFDFQISCFVNVCIHKVLSFTNCKKNRFSDTEPRCLCWTSEKHAPSDQLPSSVQCFGVSSECYLDTLICNDYTA